MNTFTSWRPCDQVRTSWCCPIVFGSLAAVTLHHLFNAGCVTLSVGLGAGAVVPPWQWFLALLSWFLLWKRSSVFFTNLWVRSNSHTGAVLFECTAYYQQKPSVRGVFISRESSLMKANFMLLIMNVSKTNHKVQIPTRCHNKGVLF